MPPLEIEENWIWEVSGERNRPYKRGQKDKWRIRGGCGERMAIILDRATTGYGFFLWDTVKYSIEDIVFNTIAIMSKDSINNPWYKYKKSDR